MDVSASTTPSSTAFFSASLYAMLDPDPDSNNGANPHSREKWAITGKTDREINWAPLSNSQGKIGAIYKEK